MFLCSRRYGTKTVRTQLVEHVFNVLKTRRNRRVGNGRGTLETRPTLETELARWERAPHWKRSWHVGNVPHIGSEAGTLETCPMWGDSARNILMSGEFRDGCRLLAPIPFVFD